MTGKDQRAGQDGAEQHVEYVVRVHGGSMLPGGAARRMSRNCGRADTRRYTSADGGGRRLVMRRSPAAAARAAGALKSSR